MTSQSKLEIGQKFIPYQTFPENNYLPVLKYLIEKRIITHTEAAFLKVLNSYAFKDGICNPSQPTLAQKVGVTKQHIINLTKSLEKKGILKVETPELIYRKLFREKNHYFFLWTVYYEFYLNENKPSLPDRLPDTPIYINQEVILKNPVPVLSENIQSAPDKHYLAEANRIAEDIAELNKVCKKRFNPVTFIGNALKNNNHIEAVIEALQSVKKYLPQIDNPWGWANKILKVKSPNFHERDFIRQSEALKNEIRIYPELKSLLQGIG